MCYTFSLGDITGCIRPTPTDSLYFFSCIVFVEDVTCICGSQPKTMEHMLRCPLLEKECDAQDLAEFNNSPKDCIQLWLKHNIYCVRGHEKKKVISTIPDEPKSFMQV